MQSYQPFSKISDLNLSRSKTVFKDNELCWVYDHVFVNRDNGGIGKVYQLFGEELWGMLEELNEVLAA